MQWCVRAHARRWARSKHTGTTSLRAKCRAAAAFTAPRPLLDRTRCSAQEATFGLDASALAAAGDELAAAEEAEEVSSSDDDDDSEMYQ